MSQSQLPSGVDTGTQSDSQTVYVVTVRWMDNPHPDVLGVYNSEEAANELMKKCRDWPRDYPTLGPVAWEKKEREIHTEFSAEQVKE